MTPSHAHQTPVPPLPRAPGRCGPARWVLVEGQSTNGMEMILEVTPGDVAIVLALWREVCAHLETDAPVELESQEWRRSIEGTLSAIPTYRFARLERRFSHHPVITALRATREAHQRGEAPWAILDAPTQGEETRDPLEPYLQPRGASVQFLSPSVAEVYPATRFAETVTERSSFVVRTTSYLVLSGTLVHDAATADRFWRDVLDLGDLPMREVCQVLAHPRVAPAWAHLAPGTLSRLLTHPEARVRTLAITRVESAGARLAPTGLPRREAGAGRVP